jgi:hypothetical protein
MPLNVGFQGVKIHKCQGTLVLEQAFQIPLSVADGQMTNVVPVATKSICMLKYRAFGVYDQQKLHLCKIHINKDNLVK